MSANDIPLITHETINRAAKRVADDSNPSGAPCVTVLGEALKAINPYVASYHQDMIDQDARIEEAVGSTHDRRAQVRLIPLTVIVSEHLAQMGHDRIPETLLELEKAGIRKLDDLVIEFNDIDAVVHHAKKAGYGSVVVDEAGMASFIERYRAIWPAVYDTLETHGLADLVTSPTYPRTPMVHVTHAGNMVGRLDMDKPLEELVAGLNFIFTIGYARAKLEAYVAEKDAARQAMIREHRLWPLREKIVAWSETIFGEETEEGVRIDRDRLRADAKALVEERDAVWPFTEADLEMVSLIGMFEKFKQTESGVLLARTQFPGGAMELNIASDLTDDDLQYIEDLINRSVVEEKQNVTQGPECTVAI